MKPRKTELTAQQIANVAGVSLTLVNRKLAQGRSPRQIIAEAEQMAQQAAQRHPVVNVAEVNGHSNGHAASFAEAQRRKELALARIREAEADEKTGELMPVEEARKWLQHIFLPLVQSFRALPDELRDPLTPGVAQLLDRRVEGVIRSADLYLENCFQRGGKPLADGALDCGGGWRVRWWIEAPEVKPPEVV